MSGVPYIRRVEYLSPSSLRQVEENPQEFYLQRCAPLENRPEKFQQTPEMAVGSAFDSYVKDALAKELKTPCPSLTKLLEHVEPWNRGEVEKSTGEKINPLEKGRELYEAYVGCGAFQALLDEGVTGVELEPAISPVPGTVHALMGKEVGGVPLRGHPDCMLVHEDGARVILDWKVTASASPHAGYRRAFSTVDPMLYQQPGHERCEEPMEQLNPDWAAQLATYSWLMRARVGKGAYFMPVKVAVDQVVYGGKGIRVAQFRTHVTGRFQGELRRRYQRAWDAIQGEKLVPEGINLDLLRLTR